MKKLLRTLNKEKTSTPPIWLMRQAGRYLPEYQKLRAEYGSFLELCYNPKAASRITLQPIERFGFDAAIIFSDILVIPDALGLKVEFVKNEGPKLQTVTNEKQLLKLKTDNITKHLQPVFENISLTKAKLNKYTSLIGFSGSAWTIATYMIEGGGSKNFEKVRRLAIAESDFFSKLINILVQVITVYLIEQIKAGVEVIKLFDSWAGILSENEFDKWVIRPNQKIIDNIKKQYPQIPIIALPKGAGSRFQDFAKQVNCDALAIDQTISRRWAHKFLQNDLNLTIQGNLSNFNLAFGSEKSIKEEVKLILDAFNKYPFIFNLEHGILPTTPVKNVELLLDQLRNNSN